MRVTARHARVVEVVHDGPAAKRRPQLLGAAQASAWLNEVEPDLIAEQREHFVVIVLDVRRRPKYWQVVAIGSMVACIVHPREVYRLAVDRGAASIIVAHNHPSGDPTPSAEDWAVTERLRRSGEILGIELLDHVVVARDDSGKLVHSSLRDECHKPK